MINKKGHTLLEIILYVSIYSVIITISIFLFLNIFYIINKNQAISEINEQGDYLLNIITKTINSANAVTAPTYGANSDSINLVNSSVSKNPTLIYLQNGNLYLKEGLDTEIMLNNSRTKIDSIQFLNISTANSQSPSIKVNLAISVNNGLPFNEMFYSSNFYTTANVR